MAVNQSNLEGFLAFAEELAEPLPTDVEAVTDWCRARIGEAAAA